MSATDPFKPLFNRRLLADAILGIDPRLDDEQRRIAASWSASAADGSLLGRKEKPLQAQFLSEVLGRLLGYHPLVGADGIHHMEPETSSKAFRGYRPPDAAVGSERLNPNPAVSFGM